MNCATRMARLLLDFFPKLDVRNSNSIPAAGCTNSIASLMYQRQSLQSKQGTVPSTSLPETGFDKVVSFGIRSKCKAFLMKKKKFNAPNL